VIYLTGAVSFEEGEQFAKEYGLVFMEASAKTAQNIEEVTVYLGPFKCNCIILCLQTVIDMLCDVGFHQGRWNNTQENPRCIFDVSNEVS
jgi:hypothetical protein